VQAAEPVKGFSLAKAVPVFVFLVALLIRLPGIGWGLKNDLHNTSYHPDEPVIFGYSRAIVPGQGQFVPGFYNYGTLYLTMLRIASDITTTYTGGPKTKGDGWSWTNPDNTDWDWVSRCDMAGRLISVFAGAGTALLAFFIGRMAFGVRAGAIAGSVMAIAPAFVMHSRFQTVDVVAMFFLTFSTFYAFRIVYQPGAMSLAKAATWSGVFAGLSAGTKYTGVLALFSLYAALVLLGSEKRPGAIKAALIGTFAAALAFVVTTPGVLLQTSIFLKDFTYEMQHTATGHDMVFTGTPSGFIYHLMNLGIGVDGLLAVLGLAGLFWAAYKKHPWAIILLAFWVPYYIVISRAEVKFIRYSIPLELAVAVGCGYLMVAAHRRGGYGRIIVGVGILGFGGFGGGGLRSTFATTLGMMRTDPRDEAVNYMSDHGGGHVGLPRDPWYWSPPLFADSAEPRSVPAPRRLAEIKSEAKLPVDLVLNSDGGFTEWDPRLVTQVRPDWIAYSSFEYLPVARLANFKDLPQDQQTVVDSANQFTAKIQESYDLTLFGSPVPAWMPEEIMPEDFLYVQPVIWVWHRK
jgi:hypothetical protein